MLNALSPNLRRALGDPCDIAIIQADHTLYSTLTASDFPETKLIIDGRNIIDETKIKPIAFKVLGKG